MARHPLPDAKPNPCKERVITMNRPVVNSVICFVLCLILLAGCGGSKGGGPVRPPVPPPPPTVEPEPEPPPEPPPPPSGPTANDFAEHPEYSINWTLDLVGAAPAYARLARRHGEEEAPGTGVTVGVIDNGIALNHWEFDPDKVSEEILEEDGGERDHGTSVASVIVARRDNSFPDWVPSDYENRDFNFHGIVWGANLKMFSIPLGTAEGPYEPITLEQLAYLSAGAAGYEWVLSSGIDILNMSFGPQGIIDNYAERELRLFMPAMIDVLAQGNRTEKKLITISAGNAHERECYQGTDNCIGATPSQPGTIDARSPEVLAGLPARIEELRSHMVAVVATDVEGNIAPFSNRCGLAAKWCIAAPGHEVLAAYYRYEPSENTGYYDYHGSSGTSLAAPLVAGGLAVMKHYFRDQLPNTDLLTRLYVTADVTPDDVLDHGGRCPAYLDTNGDLSTCELSSTLGRGLMDLDAATRPVGETSIALGNVLSGPQVAAGSTFLATGRAMGNAFSSALRGKELAVFDELGAPFWVGMDKVQGMANAGLGTRMARFMASPGAGGAVAPLLAGSLLEMPFASTRVRLASGRKSGEHVWMGGHASLVPVEHGGASMTLAEGTLEFSAFAIGSEFNDAWGGRDRNSSVGAVLGWKIPGTPLGLRAGRIREYDTALGTMGRGAFGHLDAGVAFAGLRLDTELGGWRLTGEAELGKTHAQATRGLVQSISPLGTSAFSFSGAHGLADGSWLRLSVSQPLRVEGGQFRLDMPVGRTKQGEVLREMVNVGASPSGRSLDLAAEWIRPMMMGEFRLGTTVVLHPRHDAGRKPDLVLMAGYRLVF